MIFVYSGTKGLRQFRELGIERLEYPEFRLVVKGTESDQVKIVSKVGLDQ